MSKNTTKLANALVDVQWPISERTMNVFMYLLQKQMADALLHPEHVAPIIYVDRAMLSYCVNLQGKTVHLMPLLEQLTTARFYFENADRTHVFSAPALVAYEYDRQTDMIAVEFSRLFWPYLSDLVQRYTIVDLGVFWQISGRYAKRFYLDVMRWQSHGEMILNIDNMRERYNCQYLYADMQRRVVDPAIEQIHQLTNVKVKQLPPIKKGKRVLSFRFQVTRPTMAEMQPVANDLVRKYKLTPAFANLVAQRMTGKTIAEICAAIDMSIAGKPIKNVPAYAATFFRNYGVTEPKKKANETSNAANG